MPAVLKAALMYFGMVFGCGFVLGTIRVTWLEPWIGERRAELAEMPLMLVAVFFAARFIASRVRAHLAVGLLALAFLVMAEVLVVLAVRRQGLVDYVSGRDPVSGLAYLLSLVFFAVAPALVSRRGEPGG